jgi:hypothetical protein
VKRSLALLKWKLPVIWVAGAETAAPAVEAPAVHYHLHLEAGADVAAILRQVVQSATGVPEIRERTKDSRGRNRHDGW